VLTYDDPAFSDLTDPRVRRLIDLLGRTVNGNAIEVVLGVAGLNPGNYPLLTSAAVVWTQAVPDAARLGRLGALIDAASANRPAFAAAVEQAMAQALQPLATAAGWYRNDDPYTSSFVGLRSARAVIDRRDLRVALRELAEDQYWVLVVHGTARSGKTHTWRLVDHLRTAGRLVGVNRFARVTTHDWSDEVTGEALAQSLASRLSLTIDLNPSGELDDARVRKFLDHLVGVYPNGDGVTRWIILDGLDRPAVKEGARDLARGLIRLVEDGELPQTRLIVTGLDPLGLQVGYAVRTEEIPAINRALLRAFLVDVAAHFARTPDDAELDECIAEVLGPGPGLRDLGEVERSVVELVKARWAPEGGHGG
jgi:Effector-associated domain 1